MGDGKFKSASAGRTIFTPLAFHIPRVKVYEFLKRHAAVNPPLPPYTHTLVSQNPHKIVFSSRHQCRSNIVSIS